MCPAHTHELNSMKYVGRLSVLLIAVLLVSLDAGALGIDSTKVPVRKKRPKPIKKEYTLGLRLNTDGWSVFFDRGKVVGAGRRTDYFYDLVFWQIELGEKKHPQETRRSNVSSTSTNTSTPFIYGKANNFYNFKLGYGKRKMIAGKPEHGTVSIHWVYMGGLSIGLEKPYYYEAYVSKNGGPLIKEEVRYTDTTQYLFSQTSQIEGASGFAKGIDELQIVPGLHAKTALHFDFAVSKERKLAIEAGLNVEFYTRAIQLMAYQDDRPYFVNGYVSLGFGKRWADKSKRRRR